MFIGIYVFRNYDQTHVETSVPKDVTLACRFQKQNPEKKQVDSQKLNDEEQVD